VETLDRAAQIGIKNMKNDEYEELKKFYVCFRGGKNVTYGDGRQLTTQEHLAEGEKLFGISKAKKGLLDAVNDIITQYKHKNAAEVADLDRRCVDRGCITLSTLRTRYSKQWKRILKTEVIKNETEYYLMRNILDDGGAAITKPETDMIGTMLQAYEHSKGHKKPPRTD
jgi:hypothetical protein